MLEWCISSVSFQSVKRLTWRCEWCLARAQMWVNRCQRSVFCTMYFAFCILHFVCSILYFVLCICVFVYLRNESQHSTGAGEVPQAILQGLCCPVEWSLDGNSFIVHKFDEKYTPTCWAEGWYLEAAVWKNWGWIGNGLASGAYLLFLDFQRPFPEVFCCFIIVFYFRV